MTFAAPLLLLALLAVPALLLARRAWRRRRPPAGVPFPDISLVAAAAPAPRRRRHLPLVAAVLALAAFSLALARPQMWRDVPREQATIMLVIDVSGSMAASDVEPYRLRAAQDAAKTFSARVPRQYRVGLVSFSGVATVLLPPTTDRLALDRAVESLVPDGATAVGDAVQASLQAMRQDQPRLDGERLEAAHILLLSDGASTTGSLVSQAAEDARRAGVPVFTVALGTDAGILPNGQPVPPDGPGMRDLAEATGGQFFESEDAESVSEVYERLGSFIGTERERQEVTAWPAGLGALLLVVAALSAWRLAPRLG
jgi:Ca-activated chloride channel homolog